MSETTKTLVSAEEEGRVGRELLTWLNTYPNKPVDEISFELLLPDRVGMMMSNIQAAFKLRQYICGGYQAQYQFKLVYRSSPDADDSRLAADEILNSMGAWAEENAQNLHIPGVTTISVRRDSNSSLFAIYENGERDHQILMNLIYEVI